MAKRPEDRFASYDELIAAIEAVPLAGGSEPPGVTFAPVDDSVNAVPASSSFGYGVTAVHGNGGSPSNGSADAAIPLVSMVELAAEDDRGPAVREQHGARFTAHERPSFQHRAFRSSDDHGSRTSELEAPAAAKPAGASFPASGLDPAGGRPVPGVRDPGDRSCTVHGSARAAAARCRPGRTSSLLTRQPIAMPLTRCEMQAQTGGVRLRRGAKTVMPVKVQSTAVAARPKWEEPPDDDPPDLPASAAPTCRRPSAAKYLARVGSLAHSGADGRSGRGRAADLRIRAIRRCYRTCTGRWTAGSAARWSWLTKGRCRLMSSGSPADRG